MTAHARARRIIWIRRGVQTLVLLLFVALLAANRPASGAAPTAPVSVFCGWFCPFGTLHNAVGSLRRQFGGMRPRTSGFSVWQRAKYLVVIALLVMALVGVQWAGILDPFSLLYRSLALTVLPALDVAVSTVSNAVYLGDPYLGSLHLRDATEPFYRWWQERVTATEIRVFTGTDAVFLIFVAALVLNLVRNRFWCRYVCPLGGLLGLVARRPLLRLTSDPSACNQCQKCTMACPAAAQPEKPDQWLATECFGCWNCVAACDRQGLDFGWVVPWRRTSSGSVDVGKRRALASVAVGVGAVAMARITPASQAVTHEPSLIRPPGARAGPDFLARCVKCGMCMQTCPSGGLQPTWAEAGLEGLWSPVLVPAIGWCEYECHACGQVCPTEAIQRDGSTRTLKFPRVDPDRCTGCGICETKCPFRDRAAIRVTSAGEDRHPDNQPLLGPAGGGYGDPYGY